MATRKAALPKPYVNHNFDYQELMARKVNDELRHVYFTGDVVPQAVTGALLDLDYLNAQAHAPIELRLNTFGGDVISGLSLYDSIKELNPTSPITVRASGACMSMGTIILQAGVERLAHPHTRFMLHKLSAQDSGSLDDLDDRQQDRLKIQAILNQILLERTNLTGEELNKLIRRKDYHFTAKEALEMGLIDRIVGGQ